MHIIVRILLLLFALPFLIILVLAPFAATKSIGITSLGLLIGSFGVALAGVAIMTPSLGIPDEKLTGIPDDGDLPDGVIATRFWRGFFGNKPAAILIDSMQHDLLFIGCLDERATRASPRSQVRLVHQDVKSVYEHCYYERGFKVFNLYISTTKGFLRLDKSFQNYDRIRDYFVNNYPNTTSRPFGRVFMLPLILSLAGSAGVFLGYQFGSSIGQSIRPGNPTASDEWGAVGAIVGPMVAIVICIGISHLDLRSRLDA
jgi:hypothetical protein